MVYRGRRGLFYILYGNDEFTLHEELERIKNGLGDREALASNTTVFDGKQVGFNQLMDACMAMPFLGTHRLVIVVGLLGRFGGGEDGVEGEEKKKGKKDIGEWRGLKDRIGEIAPTTVLVLLEGDVKKNNAFLKEITPVAKVKHCSALKGKALEGWIRGRVEQGGGKISFEAVKLLAELAGENLWVLASEIDKLLLFTEGRPIGDEDVKVVVSYAREVNIFTMVDAIIDGHAARAATLLHRSLEEGYPEPYLLVMITRQLRLLVKAKELSQQRCKYIEMKSRLGITSDYVLNKALEQARHYSMERLEQVYHKLLETDVSIKRGAFKGDMALDLLVAELCS